ncbi:MAG: hypothetical protein IPL51_05840 [Candidatus Competibacteraceae bacterium]|nr:hypothetical protein [Candidatus Competibacteraceae bacterium]
MPLSVEGGSPQPLSVARAAPGKPAAVGGPERGTVKVGCGATARGAWQSLVGKASNLFSRAVAVATPGEARAASPRDDLELAVARLRSADPASHHRLGEALPRRADAARLLREAPATPTALAAHLLDLEHTGVALEQKIAELTRLRPLASPEAQALTDRLIDDLERLGKALKARRGDAHARLTAPFDAALGTLLATLPSGHDGQPDGQGVIQGLAALRVAATPLTERGVDFAELLASYLEVKLNDLPAPRLDGLARALNGLVARHLKDEFKQRLERHEQALIKTATLEVDADVRARWMREDFERIVNAVNAKALERLGVGGEVGAVFQQAFVAKVMEPMNQALRDQPRIDGRELPVCKQYYADALRADYCIRDPQGRTAPLVDDSAYDLRDEERKTACQLAKVEALEEFCGGDRALTYELSQWLNQGTLAGFGKGLRSAGTPLRWEGKNIALLVGPNDRPVFELARSADDAIKVAIRFQQKLQRLELEDGTPVNLDPTASQVAFATEMTLRKGQPPSFSPIQYSYRLAAAQMPRA